MTYNNNKEVLKMDCNTGISGLDGWIQGIFIIGAIAIVLIVVALLIVIGSYFYDLTSSVNEARDNSRKALKLAEKCTASKEDKTDEEDKD